jgi:uncharacterized protein YneF (UPF0154 family)
MFRKRIIRRLIMAFLCIWTIAFVAGFVLGVLFPVKTVQKVIKKKA